MSNTDTNRHHNLPQRGRRRFIKGCALALPALPFIQREATAMQSERTLSFHHTHTNEKIALVYHDGQHYITDSLRRLNHILRDFRTGEVHAIDHQLLDVLYALKLATNSKGRYEIISGYRSPATNEKLRSNSKGVAKRSLHMQGKAIDVRLTDVDTRALRKAAVHLKQGGVGYYQRSDFVHLDTGRFRTW